MIWAVLPGEVAVDFWLRPILHEDMPGGSFLHKQPVCTVRVDTRGVICPGWC